LFRESHVNYLGIALGSAIGGIGRYYLQGVVARHYGAVFPLGTMAVNVLGCLVIGFVAAFTSPDGRLLVSPNVRQFVMVGLCGGFTTFSSFSLETLHLVRDGQWFRATLNVAGSVILCLVAVWLGHALARKGM